MKKLFILALLFCSVSVFSQKLNSKKVGQIISSKFNKLDISYLWVSPDTDFVQVGFIGENYQRFRIHFASVTKSKHGHDTYLVKGKTKVKDNICDFVGEMYIDTVIESQYMPEVFNPDTMRSANIYGTYVFNEDKANKSGGVLKGTFDLEITIDRKYKPHYSDLFDVADSYSNNHFNGTWSSYDGNIIERCNWGDCRVDSSGDLDWGVGEFYVNEKYIQNGWQDYWNNPPSTMQQLDVYIKDKKRSQWWKE